MTIQRSLACVLAAVAACAAIGLDRDRAVAATVHPATTDATTYFVPPSFDIQTEPPQPPRVATLAPAPSDTSTQRPERGDE